MIILSFLALSLPYPLKKLYELVLTIQVIYTVPLLLDTVIDFHKTYNAQNINRFPISFFIYHRDKIILGFKIIFLGVLLMLYGICFKNKI